ncbi:MAG: PEGA domain-containing protein [Deltaproteobacteria bacterium]|nr:PEGA domain-containing protein [Deltaproteobacteria bacterium]
MKTRTLAVHLLGLILLSIAPGADAAKPSKPKEPVVDEATAQARDEFMKGTAAVKTTQWSEALLHFEKANTIKPSPVAVFNIGYCQRAMGRYVLAKAAFERAVQDAENMPEAQLEEAKTFIKELDEQLGRVKITIDPPTTRLAIDGRPLVPLKAGDPKVMVAGVAPAGEGETPPVPTFEVILDPGPHLFAASFPGHANVLLNKTIEAKSRAEIPLKLSELPANIHVESDQQRAVVVIDGRDVGLAPVDITRPAGRYRLQVQKKGFVAYETTLTLTPGQKANLRAQMTPETESITQKWWFWGGTAAIIAGGITATYLLTRPEAQPPDYQRGSLGWLATPR